MAARNVARSMAQSSSQVCCNSARGSIGEERERAARLSLAVIIIDEATLTVLKVSFVRWLMTCRVVSSTSLLK